ncbi:hypothetical protein IEO21_05164 [Rhodonia placenta]|uniref:Fungal-type protein kinase domain-containing protein n=1 Tax=Rhodonia placenta TaxID=104341 RepID=A0A8H7U2I5_9APHY|nr:hypothetical protein IEO21_05164 [Postia placenta]
MCVPVIFLPAWATALFDFNDAHDDPDRWTGLQQEMRGRIAHCASEVVRHQHRVFCFLIVICRREARLLRHDRAGIVFTRPFDLVDGPMPLYSFLYRLNNMSRRERGYDPTVALATEEEVDAMRACTDALPKDDYRLRRWEKAFVPKRPVHKVMVPQEHVVSVKAWQASGEAKVAASASSANMGSLSEDPDPFGPGTSSTAGTTSKARTAPKACNRPAVHYRCFLICKHDFSSDSPIGRGTRGYLAYDMKTGKFVYLKDSWRVSTGNSEIKVYQHLHEHGVENIATPICGGDVVDINGTPHRTLAQKYNRKAEYVHCRLVVEEIGESILDYPTSKDLVAVMYGALVAHRQACERAKVMHRDISEANMLMIPDPNSPHDDVTKRGILIDWDLCKSFAQLENGAKQNNRSGTWQFMSALLLLRPGLKQHTVADDLESFMHVLNWICLRYHKTIHDEDLQVHVSSVFDGPRKRNPEDRTGGRAKVLCILDGNPSAQLSFPSPLKGLVDKLAELCKAQYNATDLTPYAEFVRNKAPIPASFYKDEDEDVLRSGDPVNTKSIQESVPDPVLSTHNEIVSAFKRALRGLAQHYPEKEADKFEKFAKIDRSLYSVHSSFSGSKRYSEELGDGGDEEQPLAKKLRPARTKQQPSHTLGAIIENEATRDQPVAGGSQAAGHRDG